MKTDIKPKNPKGNYHGYQLWYWFDELWFSGVYKHGVKIGYSVNHYNKQTIYHIK